MASKDLAESEAYQIVTLLATRSPAEALPLKTAVIDHRPGKHI